MPEGQKFKPDIEQIKVDLKAPKTAEQWCELYKRLIGQDIFLQMNWGNEAESQRPLNFAEFQKKIKACKINLADSQLIAEANKKILE